MGVGALHSPQIDPLWGKKMRRAYTRQRTCFCVDPGVSVVTKHRCGFLGAEAVCLALTHFSLWSSYVARLGHGGKAWGNLGARLRNHSRQALSMVQRQCQPHGKCKGRRAIYKVNWQ